MKRKTLGWRFINPVFSTFCALSLLVLICLAFLIFVTYIELGVVSDEWVEIIKIPIFPYVLLEKLHFELELRALFALAQLAGAGLYVASAQPRSRVLRWLGSVLGVLLTIVWFLYLALLTLISGIH